MKITILKNTAKKRVNVTEDSIYLCLLDPKTKNGSVNLELNFKKENITGHIIFVGALEKNSRWKIKTSSKHLTSKTSCQTDIFLTLKDKVKVDYLGEILIDKKAEKTESFLQERTLLLGESIYNRSQPILEIYNNQVKASHAASSSRLNEKELFYLMSRGLKRKEAEKILEKAFFAKLVENIDNEEAQKIINDYLEEVYA